MATAVVYATVRIVN